VAFGCEVVVENRVFVWFSEEGVWSVVGGGRQEAPIGMTNSVELNIFKRRRPLNSAVGAVVFVRGDERECAGLVSPIR